jgi:hypothetical protein
VRVAHHLRAASFAGVFVMHVSGPLGVATCCLLTALVSVRLVLSDRRPPAPRRLVVRLDRSVVVLSAAFALLIVERFRVIH